MIVATAAPLLALLAATGAGASARDLAGVEFAETGIIIRQRTIVRVPLPPPKPVPAARWREKKGPRCIQMRDIAGAAIVGEDTVDIIFRGGFRIRVQLESACPALDFYGGFYIRPGADGRVCADRDAIHARSGGVCEIERFRLLTPAARR